MCRRFYREPIAQPNSCRLSGLIRFVRILDFQVQSNLRNSEYQRQQLSPRRRCFAHKHKSASPAKPRVVELEGSESLKEVGISAIGGNYFETGCGHCRSFRAGICPACAESDSLATRDANHCYCAGRRGAVVTSGHRAAVSDQFSNRGRVQAAVLSNLCGY